MICCCYWIIYLLLFCGQDVTCCSIPIRFSASLLFPVLAFVYDLFGTSWFWYEQLWYFRSFNILWLLIEFFFLIYWIKETQNEEMGLIKVHTVWFRSLLILLSGNRRMFRLIYSFRVFWFLTRREFYYRKWILNISHAIRLCVIWSFYFSCVL